MTNRRDFITNSAKFGAAAMLAPAFIACSDNKGEANASGANSASADGTANSAAGNPAENGAFNSGANSSESSSMQTLALPKRKLRDLEVSAIGYGCMGLSHGYGEIPSEADAISYIHKSYELGCTFFDTAEGYGSGHNETLLGKAMQGFRDDIIVATKFRFDDNQLANINAANAQQFIEAHIDASLQKLQTDRIDLYYWHRIQPKADLEQVAQAMGALIKKGKIRAWGLSQCSADEIEKANAVTPVSAVQSEYSIMERMFEKDVIPLCEKLGVGFVAFSPMASGFLSGKYNAQTQYKGDDVRRAITRFETENVKANQALLDLLKGYADAKGASLAQISLAFLLAKKPFIVPIPGTRKFERIEENQRAAFVELSASEMSEIESALSKVQIYGNRTDEDLAKFRNTLEKEKNERK